MNSTGPATLTHSGTNRSRRRSASLSPSRSPLPERPLKRKRTLAIIPVINTQPESNGQLYYRRKSSLFSKFSWSRRSSGFNKMADFPYIDDNKEQASINQPYEENSMVATMNDFIRSGSDHAEESRRSSSRLSSISSHIKSFFTDPRRRRDSPAEAMKGEALEDVHGPLSLSLAAPSPNYIKPDVPFHLSSLRSGTPASADICHGASMMGLEPYAVEGSLRFANKSTESVQYPPGPSDYWRKEEYQGRDCQHQKQSPYYGRAKLEPPFNSGIFSQNTNDHIMNSEPGVEKYPWERSNDDSPVLPPTHRPSLVLPHLHLPSFGRKKRNAKGKQAVSREASRAPSTTTPSFSFGPGPDLNFSISTNDLGVLPDSDVPSVEDSIDIPHPLYASTTNDRPPPPSNMHKPTQKPHITSQTSLLDHAISPPAEHNAITQSQSQSQSQPLPRTTTTSSSRSSSLSLLRPTPLHPFSRPPTPRPSSPLCPPGSPPLISALDPNSPPNLRINHHHHNLQPHYTSLLPPLQPLRAQNPNTAMVDGSDSEHPPLRRVGSLSAVLEGNEVVVEWRRLGFEVGVSSREDSEAGSMITRMRCDGRGRGRTRGGSGMGRENEEEQAGADCVDWMDLDE